MYVPFRRRVALYLSLYAGKYRGLHATYLMIKQHRLLRAILTNYDPLLAVFLFHGVCDIN